MGNDLIPSGGGAIVPGSAGSAVGDYVGDITLDRGPTQVPAANERLFQDLERAIGSVLTPEKIQSVREVLKQDRLAEDERQKQAAVKAMRSEWGASGYGERTRRIIAWLATLPGNLGEEILNARENETGDVICSKPAVLRAMYAVAAATILASDDERDKAVCERTLQAEWKGAYHSHIATVKRYLDTVPRSIREGLLNARDDNDVATTNDPKALKWLLQLARPRLDGPRGDPAPDVTAISSERRREIEQMMADHNSLYWKDDGHTQAEYRELLERGVPTDLVSNTSDAHLSRRIGEIERWMGAKKGSSEYKKYWEDPVAQREYGELLERREQHRSR